MELDKEEALTVIRALQEAMNNCQRLAKESSHQATKTKHLRRWNQYYLQLENMKGQFG